jgi:hypothetical protein
LTPWGATVIVAAASPADTSGGADGSVAVVSVAIPPVSAFLLGFLPLPERIDDLIIWYVMLAFAIVIPPLVTFAIVRALPPDDRPHGFAALAGMPLDTPDGGLEVARRSSHAFQDVRRSAGYFAVAYPRRSAFPRS